MSIVVDKRLVPALGEYEMHSRSRRERRKRNAGIELCEARSDAEKNQQDTNRIQKAASVKELRDKRNSESGKTKG